MLEHFYESSWHLRQLRQAPFSESINALASRLYQLGYPQRYGQRILWVVGKFNDYARAIGIANAEAVNESLMQRFVKEELTHQVGFAPIAMRHLWKHLRDQGIVPMVPAPHLDDPCEPILRNYDEHLCNVRGLVLTSRTESLRYARRFFHWLRDRHGDKFIDRLNGVDVLEFITEFAGLHASGSWRNNLCSHTRVFLRYLRWRGIIDVDLDRVVPKLPKWRLSEVPRHLPWEEVRKLIESIDTSKPTGLRDKAVLLLIAVLGLRNQEVRCLQLTDIFWRTAEIRLRKTKNRRERILPLPREVGTSSLPATSHSLGSDHLYSWSGRHCEEAPVTCRNPSIEPWRSPAPPQPRNTDGQPIGSDQADRRYAWSRQHRYDRHLHQGRHDPSGCRRPSVSRR